MQTWRSGLAMILWVPFTFYVFRRYGTARAAMICFLGGAMFLPELSVIKFPMFPEIDKGRLVVLSMLLALVFVRRARLRGRVERWWFALVPWTFISSMGTWLTNTDPMPCGFVELPGHTFTDAMYFFLSTMTSTLLASYLGMVCFRDEDDLEDVVVVLAGAGLVYIVPILVEIKMSPQLHKWVYGYAAFEDFLQSIRYGGYRPQVFMMHGLLTSLFMLGPATAAVAAARLRLRIWRFPGRAAAWATVLAVIACRSTGVWFYALISLPLVRWLSPKAMGRVAMLAAALTIIYPWLRITDRVPLDTLLDYAGQISEERRASLEFRFINEEVLLEKALQREWFGWGSYGRNRIYDDVGSDVSTTDGGWILALGSVGIVGFMGRFGLPFLSVLTVTMRLRRIRNRRLAVMVAAINLYLALFWFDMIPNAPGIFIPHFLGGALCSITYHLLRQPRRARAPQAPETPPRPAVSEPTLAVGEA